MLRTRLWMGAILVALVAGVLVVDRRLGPYYPFLLALVLFLAEMGCWELLRLLPAALRPPAWLCHAGVGALVFANWPAHLPWLDGRGPWYWVAGAFAAVVLAAFLAEMAAF